MGLYSSGLRRSVGQLDFGHALGDHDVGHGVGNFEIALLVEVELLPPGLAVGTLFMVRMLAPFLVSPVAGVVADRYNRKWILIATDLGRIFTALGFVLHYFYYFCSNGARLWGCPIHPC